MSISEIRLGQLFVAGDVIYFKSGSHYVCEVWSRQRFKVNPFVINHDIRSL